MEDNHSDSSSVSEKDETVNKEVSNTSSRRNSSEEPVLKDSPNHRNNNLETDESSDDECKARVARSKKRVQRFTDSEEESEISNVQNIQVNEAPAAGSNIQDSDGSSDSSIFKSVLQKSRIRKVSTSGSEPELHSSKALKNEEQQTRMKNKSNKLSQKFKGLINSRMVEVDNETKQMEKKNEERESEGSNTSDDEAASIEKIRQKIKERTMILKSTIYDSDSSDEDRTPTKEIQKQKKGRKSTKLTSPQPIRMSAKQAMENMQKIKSESNRMLREKDVSLPYHRPKALSLKDIMSRRRPAVSADGKALPIKMNEEQLKQYALSLEQRQKEMIELCKSDTDDEGSDEKDESEDIPSINDTTYDVLVQTNTGGNSTSIDEENIEKNADLDKLANNNSSDIQIISTNANETEEDSSKIKDAVETTDLKNNISVEFLDDREVNTSTEMKLVYNDSVEDTKTEDVVNTTDLKDNALEGSHDDNALEGNKSSEMELVYNDSVDETKSENLVNAIALKNDENHDDNILEGNKSTEMELVYNDSVDKTKTAEDISNEIAPETLKSKENIQNVGTEPESQLISLHYDSEPVGNTEQDELEYIENIKNLEHGTESERTVSREVDATRDEISNFNDDFSDDDVNMVDIDALIENAEIIASQTNGDISSPMLIRDPQPLKTNPTLTGAPGMMIDLDGGDAFKKLTGIELLKKRFIYFARIKTPEELEKAKEKRMKPGTQHVKLKQELGEMIAEQRSLEWAKRLEDEKQHKIELDAIRGETSECEEEDIDKIEAKLSEKDDVEQESSSESEEELEDIYDVKEKPRIRNPMIADEAEESDCDEDQGGEEIEGNDADGDDEDEESDEESSEESEDEQQSNVKKGRILKAFEDSDDEDTIPKSLEDCAVNTANSEINNGDIDSVVIKENNTDVAVIKDTQDDELQLAQMHKSLSEDLFTSQESCLVRSTDKPINIINNSSDDKELVTQTFSILDSSAKQDGVPDLPDNFTIVSETQPYDDGDLDAVVGMCSGSFSQNLVTPHYISTQMSQSQAIGEDVLALCTGKFYDNQFVSQLDNGTNSKNIVDENNEDIVDKISQDIADVSNTDNACTTTNQADISQKDEHTINKIETKENDKESNLLQSMLDELNDPEFEKPKQYKYFVGNESLNKENKSEVANSQIKKKLVIDSDDETGEVVEEIERKKKKFKKRKVEKRALQISDDEEENESNHEEEEEEMSEIENDAERVVEYDSEENEIVIQPQISKKKRKLADFFEQEAELTSEDEWAGSGDEDEAGLDRMEREAGDDDSFHQGRLQRELGQIHMREVMDQDKREVRLIQELLLEDGDLGEGHRQRKFRWKNADGDDETDGAYSELADTQEEEFESEEQWRRQRHERDMFLKQMQKDDDAKEPLNVSITRTSIIKANLTSKSMSTLLMEVNTSKTEQIENIEKPVPEKKTAKDIPTPKTPFSILQQNYHGSLLTRGRGALARLAALATPLAGDDDAPKVGSIAPSSKRNFVFATLTPDVEKPKVTKRKADVNVGTPKLVKKIKTEERRKLKSSLLDHIKA